MDAWNRGVIYYNDGKVGIGTESPAEALHISGDDYHSAIKVQGTGTGYGPRILIWSYAANGRNFSLKSGQTFDYGGTITGKFAIVDDSAGAVRAVVDGSGSVGIGTNAPQAKLHVAGDVRVDGNIAAKYQDMAEWVSSDLPLEAGTVVITDPQKEDQVLPSETPYDTRVAGVVSSSPGIVLGQGGAGKVRIATMGRVKVKVDASGGPIQIGDLLVTSGIPGVAMRSQAIEVAGMKIHQPGTLLGKALQPLKSGKSEILVLLSLQ